MPPLRQDSALPAIPFKTRAVWAGTSLGVLAIAFAVEPLRLATAPLYDFENWPISMSEMRARDALGAFTILGFAAFLFPAAWHRHARRRQSADSSWLHVVLHTNLVALVVLFLAWGFTGFQIVHLHVLYGIYFAAVLLPRIAIPQLRPGRVLQPATAL